MRVCERERETFCSKTPCIRRFIYRFIKQRDHLSFSARNSKLRYKKGDKKKNREREKYSNQVEREKSSKEAIKSALRRRSRMQLARGCSSSSLPLAAAQLSRRVITHSPFRRFTSRRLRSRERENACFTIYQTLFSLPIYKKTPASVNSMSSACSAFNCRGGQKKIEENLSTSYLLFTDDFRAIIRACGSLYIIIAIVYSSAVKTVSFWIADCSGNTTAGGEKKFQALKKSVIYIYVV